MNKPEVRIIENQYETTSPANVSISEQIALLSKYGYNPQSIQSEVSNSQTERGGLTFEQMIELEEQKRQSINRRSSEPIIETYSIDRDRVQFQDSKYSTFDDDSSYGFEIKIVSDMKIPKY